MAYRLDVVAVQVAHEGSIVVAVVLRPKARRTVIGAASGKCGLIKGIDLLARSRPESKMATLAWYLGLQQAELTIRIFAWNWLYPTKQHAVIVKFFAHSHCKWCQRGRIERSTGFQIRNVDNDVVDHEDLRCNRPLPIRTSQCRCAKYDQSLERLKTRLLTSDSQFESEQIVARILRDALASCAAGGQSPKVVIADMCRKGEGHRPTGL